MTRDFPCLALGIVLALAAPAQAADEADSTDNGDHEAIEALEAFRLGGSCAGLSYLNARQIAQLVHITFQEELHAFCYPEDPFECVDYLPYLQGAGFLSKGEDDFHCRLHVTM